MEWNSSDNLHGSEASESKPLGRVHVPRVHARAACDHPIPTQNKNKANASV